MPGLQNTKATLDFLGTIGTTDRGDSLPTNNVARGLVQLAGFLIDTATDNLQRKGNIASGETASSMKVVNVDLKAPKMSLDVEILSTYKFLDQGVKGVDSGDGKYQFRTKGVGKKMHSAILRWLKTRAASGKIKYKAVSKTERKSKKIHKAVSQAKSRESLAYAVATSIKKRGIKKTMFFSNAIKDTRKQSIKILGQAFKLDIIESITPN